MTTLKVESMDFPPVIVCPPKGLSLSNSLKFDLSRLANLTLTSAAKKRLKLKARELFKNQAPELYAEKILGLVKCQAKTVAFQVLDLGGLSLEGGAIVLASPTYFSTLL